MTVPDRSLTVRGTVLTDGHESTATTVEIVDGRIASVTTSASADGADIVVDGWIVPGLIDLQINGAGGIDLTSDTRPDDALGAVARILPRHGVTPFSPTLITSPRATPRA